MTDPWANQGYAAYQQGGYGAQAQQQQQPSQAAAVDQQYAYGATAQQSISQQSSGGAYGSGYSATGTAATQSSYGAVAPAAGQQGQQIGNTQNYTSYDGSSGSQAGYNAQQGADQYGASSYGAASGGHQQGLPGLNNTQTSNTPGYGQQQQLPQQQARGQQPGNCGVPYSGPSQQTAGGAGDSNSKLASIIAQASSLAAAQQQQQTTPTVSAHPGAQQQPGYGSYPQTQAQAGHRGSYDYSSSTPTSNTSGGYATGGAVAGSATPPPQYPLTQQQHSGSVGAGTAVSSGGMVPGLGGSSGSNMYGQQQQQPSQQVQQASYGTNAVASAPAYGHHASDQGGSYGMTPSAKPPESQGSRAPGGYGIGGAASAATTGGGYAQTASYDHTPAAAPDCGYGGGNSGHAVGYGAQPVAATEPYRSGGGSGGGNYGVTSSDTGYGGSYPHTSSQQAGSGPSSAYGGGQQAPGAATAQQGYPSAHDGSGGGSGSSGGGGYGVSSAYGHQQQPQQQQARGQQKPAQPRQSRFSPAPPAAPPAAPQPPAPPPPAHAHSGSGYAGSGYGSGGGMSVHAQPPSVPAGSYGLQTGGVYTPPAAKADGSYGAASAGHPRPPYGQPPPPPSAHRAAPPPHGTGRGSTRTAPAAYGRGAPPTDSRRAYGSGVPPAPPPGAGRGSSSSNFSAPGGRGYGSSGASSGGRGAGSDRPVPQSLANAVALAQGSSASGYDRSRHDARTSSKSGGASDRRDDRRDDCTRDRDRDRRPRPNREGREPSRRDSERHRDASYEPTRSRDRGREDREPRGKREEVPPPPPPPVGASARQPDRAESSHRDRPSSAARRKAVTPPPRAIEYGIKVPTYPVTGAPCGYLEASRRYPNATLSHDLVSIVPCWHHFTKGKASRGGRLGCSVVALEGGTDISHEVDFKLQQPLRPPLVPASDGVVYSAKVLLSVGLGSDGRKAFLNGPAHGGDTLHRMLKFVTMRTEKARERSGIQAPGGVVDPAVDGDPTLGDGALIRAAVRGVRQQLGVELPLTEGWSRLLELHYSRPSENGGNQPQREVTVFFVTDLFSALPTAETWPAAWQQQRQWLASKSTHQAAIQAARDQDLKGKDADKAMATKEASAATSAAEAAGSGGGSNAGKESQAKVETAGKLPAEAAPHAPSSEVPPADTAEAAANEEAAEKAASGPTGAVDGGVHMDIDVKTPPKGDAAKAAGSENGSVELAKQPSGAGEKATEATPVIQEPQPPQKPSLMFIGRRSEGKVWRSQAISLDGLLDYEEGDREEGTVELSLAAEALQEAFAATFASTLADHLLGERATIIARRTERKKQKDAEEAAGNAAANSAAGQPELLLQPKGEPLAADVASVGIKRAAPESPRAEAQVDDSKRIKTEAAADTTNEMMETDAAANGTTVARAKIATEGKTEAVTEGAAADSAVIKKEGSVAADASDTAETTPEEAVPAATEGEEVLPEAAAKAAVKRGGRKPAAKKPSAKKRPARKTKAVLKAEAEAAAAAAATAGDEEAKDAIQGGSDDVAVSEAPPGAADAPQPMAVDLPAGAAPGQTHEVAAAVSSGDAKHNDVATGRGEAAKELVKGGNPGLAVPEVAGAVSTPPAASVPEEFPMTTSSAVAADAAAAAPRATAVVSSLATPAASPAKAAAGGSRREDGKVPEGDGLREGSLVEGKEGGGKGAESAPKKTYRVDDRLLAACRYFDRTGGGWIKADDLRRMLHILARDDLPHWLVKEASVLLAPEGSRAATRSSRIAFRDIYSEEVHLLLSSAATAKTATAIEALTVGTS